MSTALLRRRWVAPSFPFLIFVVTLVGCESPQPLAPFEPPEKDYSRPLPPGQMALVQIPPEQYPDFSAAFPSDPVSLRTAIEHSLSYLAKPSSQRAYPYGDIPHARVVASLHAFLQLLDDSTSADQFDRLVRERFDVFQSVGWNGEGDVLFTGYYTPIFDARRERTREFRYPLYRRPPDLVTDAEGAVIGQRQPDGTISPGYPTRRTLEENRRLDGLELVYLRSPFEAYVVSVQGSARLRLASGELLELGYAGTNGRDYTAVALEMVQAGELDADDVSLQTMLEYFRSRPAADTFRWTWLNDRYTFFQETSGGPYGSLGVPVTINHSIATDKSVYPRAAMAMVVADIPITSAQDDGLVHQFALDQDTGGAIRAAGRCDVYMGVGPAAEARAGRTLAEGDLYYVFAKQW